MTDGAVEEIRLEARRADALQREARDLLVDATHRAAAAGLTQREIAEVVGRSQPEVSRLLKQAQPGPLALKVSRERERLLAVLSRYGVTEVHLFGSVATRTEGPQSDVDLLVETPEALGLGTLSRLESELAAILEVPVDAVPLRGLPPHVKERALAEAVPL